MTGTNSNPIDTTQQLADVAHSYPVSGNRADYSQPELLIRTFQGQLDAMMIEQETHASTIVCTYQYIAGMASSTTTDP